MAITPPSWRPDAIPSKKGWRDPNTNGLLLEQQITREEIDEYLGVTAQPVVAEPEPVVDITSDVEEMIEDMQTPGALIDAQRADLNKLTKDQLEELGREHGIELDRRFLKSKMVDQLLEHLS